MQYEVNECCGCASPAYPCRGPRCELRHVTRYQCDRCGEEDLTYDQVRELDGQDLCLMCYDEEAEE
jgi:formylmethanofuran dehydrogenase subunit E